MTRRSVAGLALALALLAAACGGGKAQSKPAGPQGPIGPMHAVQNVQFWYQAITQKTDLAKFGDVSIVVTALPGPNEQAVVERIHKSGAKAYRYLQSYWYPGNNQTYDGVNISKHPEWMYCSAGDTPRVGRTRDGVPWYFVDNNSASWRAALRTKLAKLKSYGWDGVMFDRGLAALAGGDEEKADIWYRPSTCSKDPVTADAPFADAFIGVMREVRQAGLQLVQNYGISPFDPRVPFRPDPTDPKCQQADWESCRFIKNGIDNVSYFLNEAAAHPRAENWEPDFQANLRNEQDPEFGGKVIGLITQGTLGTDYSRDNVYFQWARIRIFSMPVGVFTGNDGCAKNAQLCNRRGLFPELNSIEFGLPLEGEPQSVACDAGSATECVWLRRYERGMSVVNVSGTAKTVELPATGQRCATVTDVYDRRPVGSCSETLRLTVPPWSGRPVVYSS